MRNIWTICRRELYSYFVSPIAWVLLAIFAFLSGVFTYIISASFARASLESQMSGQSMPMNLNEQVIAPLFSNIAVVGLFLIPLISMRLFAEEKRQGTIELLITSPLHDLEIVIGKWLSAVLMYGALLAILLVGFLLSVHLRQPRLETGGQRVRGDSAARRMPAGLRHLHLHSDSQSDRGWRHRIRARAHSVDTELDYFLRQHRFDPGSELSLDRQPHGQLFSRRYRH